MATQTIFYSWQSDLPNSINRGFIQDCLERAIKELKSDEELALDPCLDRDTSGVLLLARSAGAARALTRAFKAKTVRKLYWALCVGVPRPAQEVETPTALP